MTKEPKTISENTYLAKAEDRLKELHVHSLVAVSDCGSRVTGIFELQ